MVKPGQKVKVIHEASAVVCLLEITPVAKPLSLKPGQPSPNCLHTQIMEMLYFVDKDDPKRKRLALSAISQKVGTLLTPIFDPQRHAQTLDIFCCRQVDRYAPMPTPPDALSPRSRSRANRIARRVRVSDR